MFWASKEGDAELFLHPREPLKSLSRILLGLKMTYVHAVLEMQIQYLVFL